jgi:tRNA (mo5U34)-methyltransferase
MSEPWPTDPNDPRLAGWYHTIELGPGLESRAHFDHRPVIDHFRIPDSLAGLTCLDIGTGDGFFAFEMERRGAERVVAVDLPRIGDCDWLPRMKPRLGPVADNHDWPRNFRLAHAMRGSRVEHRFLSIYDLSPYTLGVFDLVFCGSLLLHLQEPLRALHAIRSVTRHTAIIETAVDLELERTSPGRSVMAFGCPGPEVEAGEKNVYWQFTTPALQRMLEYADFATTEPHGTFLLPHDGVQATAVTARTGS